MIESENKLTIAAFCSDSCRAKYMIKVSAKNNFYSKKNEMKGSMENERKKILSKLSEM